MDGKITLITPPDIFENSNKSIIFFHLSEDDQDTVSTWLNESKIEEDINLYVYNGEDNLPWLFYAMAQCDFKYVDLNGQNLITQALSGYMLGKPNFYYKTNNEELAAVYSHINNNRVSNIEVFLERILIG